MKVWAVSLLTMELSPHSLTLRKLFQYSEFGRNTYPKARYSFQCSTPGKLKRKLALKLFRGEPAITKLD